MIEVQSRHMLFLNKYLVDGVCVVYCWWGGIRSAVVNGGWCWFVVVDEALVKKFEEKPS